MRVISLPATSNWAYFLHITTTNDLDQHIEFRNVQPLTPKDVRLADVNADGFLDVMVVGGKDHRDKDWFKTWLYDRKGEKYKWINESRSHRDKTERFRSHWKDGQRAQVTTDLVALLKIGMTKDQVASILEQPSRLSDGMSRDGNTEKWTFTITLARLLTLTFEKDRLIDIDGG